MMHFFRIGCALIIFVAFILSLVVAERAGADEWCEGYTLTDDPAMFDGYMVGLKEYGSEFVYRRTGQGYQIFAGEGPATLDPRLCFEIIQPKENYGE
jgi:hypothetical protein